jgi:mRNA interferase MazF
MLMTQSTIVYSFGDVVLVPFPFTDQTTNKKRPAVVVSSDPYHQVYADLILIAVTSRISPNPRFGEIVLTGWSSSGLIKPSTIKPVLMTVEASLVIRKLGELQAQDRISLQSILRAIVDNPQNDT